MNQRLKEALTLLSDSWLGLVIAREQCRMALNSPTALPIEKEYYMKEIGKISFDLADIRYIYESTI